MVVMVVEDNPVSAKLLEHILRNAGHDVVVAGSRGAAVRLLDTRPDVQLIVCDIELPDGSGIDLVAELRARGGEFARLPIIMCTGADDPESVRAAIGAGCCSYLLKPVNAVKLLDRVAACAPAPAER